MTWTDFEQEARLKTRPLVLAHPCQLQLAGFGSHADKSCVRPRANQLCQMACPFEGRQCLETEGA